MGNKIMEKLEILEEEIESIKWLVTAPFSSNKASVSNAIKSIRETAGILGEDSPKGTTYENKVRREWKASLLKRMG